MNELLGILLTTAICGGLALIAGILTRRRESILGYVGAGLLGWLLGGWFGRTLGWRDPATLTVLDTPIGLLFTFMFTLGFFLLLRVMRRRR